jgi:hypothetical protein
MEKLIEQYIATFSEKEKKAYEIAKEHLGMSFQIEKSNGFIRWLKEHPPPACNPCNSLPVSGV